jgi:hypothetical protein
MRHNPCFLFPSRQVLVNDILPRATKWTKERFILFTFKSCHSCIVSFDLSRLKAKVDTFVMIVHFLNDKWEPCHITIGFFETITLLGMPWPCKSMMCLQSMGSMFESSHL